MSWWISLVNDDDSTCTVDPHAEGGTYALGGTPEAELNVTYNYSEVTRLVGFNFKGSLHGKKAKDTIPILADLVEKLGTTRFENYWAPTPGNAGYAASILLKWAREHPDAHWQVH